MPADWIYLVIEPYCKCQIDDQLAGSSESLFVGQYLYVMN